jgi:hypothetical protein
MYKNDFTLSGKVVNHGRSCISKQTDMRSGRQTGKTLKAISYSTFSKTVHYTPWRGLWGEEIQLLLILDLRTRWGELSASRQIFTSKYFAMC